MLIMVQNPNLPNGALSNWFLGEIDPATSLSAGFVEMTGTCKVSEIPQFDRKTKQPIGTIYQVVADGVLTGRAVNVQISSYVLVSEEESLAKNYADVIKDYKAKVAGLILPENRNVTPIGGDVSSTRASGDEA